MSLSEREQQALDSIEDRLARSDPPLASLLATFTRLTSGEEMPVREKIRAAWPQVTRRLRHEPRRWHLNTVCWPARRTGRRLGWHRVMLLLWLIVSIALVAVALTVSHGGGKGACTAPWVVACTGPASAHAARSARAMAGGRASTARIR